MSAIAERFDGSQLRRPRNVQVQRHHHPRYSKASLRWSCRVSCAKHTQHTSSSHAYTLRVVSCAEFLCAELQRFKLNDIEFYLPQFCNLLLTRQRYPQAIEEYAHTPPHTLTHTHTHTTHSRLCVRVRCVVRVVSCRAAVSRWLIGLCRNSLHLALRTYFIVRAAVEDSIPETLKRARLLERKLMELVLGPNSGSCVVSCRVACVVSCRVVSCAVRVVCRVVCCAVADAMVTCR